MSASDETGQVSRRTFLNAAAAGMLASAASVDGAAVTAPVTLYNGLRLARPRPLNGHGFSDRAFDPPYLLGTAMLGFATP